MLSMAAVERWKELPNVCLMVVKKHICRLSFRVCMLLKGTVNSDRHSNWYSANPGGGGGTWVNFCWVCATGLSKNPYPIIVYSLANN